MPKDRVDIPKSTQEAVLKEYSHSCAICGARDPQLHHIDENPSNNAPLNLIPLCPNHHLNGQHRLHYAIPASRLLLFRIHKHTGILAPQFTPLFNRMLFMEDIPDEAQAYKLVETGEDLCELVNAHVMGNFYAKQLRKTLPFRGTPNNWPNPDDSYNEAFEQESKEIDKEYLEELRQVRTKIQSIVVELLWYQPWASPPFSSSVI